jgi:hypothetical protein
VQPIGSDTEWIANAEYRAPLFWRFRRLVQANFPHIKVAAIHGADAHGGSMEAWRMIMRLRKKRSGDWFARPQCNGALLS